jgi:hypothetical protein
VIATTLIPTKMNPNTVMSVPHLNRETLLRQSSNRNIFVVFFKWKSIDDATTIAAGMTPRLALEGLPS